MSVRFTLRVGVMTPCTVFELAGSSRYRESFIHGEIPHSIELKSYAVVGAILIEIYHARNFGNQFAIHETGYAKARPDQQQYGECYYTQVLQWC